MNETLNDSGNCQRLVKFHKDNLLYCHAMKKWLVWDGARWKPDATGRAIALAHDAALRFQAETIAHPVKYGSEGQRFATQSLNEGRIHSALSLAQHYLFVEPQELDKNEWDFNFSNGTVDLRTGKLRKHSPKDRITKVIGHPYDEKAECPTWHRFLDSILRIGGLKTPRDASKARIERLKGFLQRALGYSMTGTTRDKSVFFLFGVTDSGKSTLITVFSTLMADYATMIQVESLMASTDSTDSRSDLADLRGARFAYTSETEKGQKLAQARLKSICQGMGSIRARRLYEDWISFEETHKLWVDSNHRPEITDATDGATFRRLCPLELLYQVPASEQDPELVGKLIEEGSGITSWAVKGAGEWYRHGLQPPIEILRGIESWSKSANQVERFVELLCETGEGLDDQAHHLYFSYQNWANAADEKEILTQTAFGLAMSKKFSKIHKNDGTHYMGVKCRVLTGLDGADSATRH